VGVVGSWNWLYLSGQDRLSYCLLTSEKTPGCGRQKYYISTGWLQYIKTSDTKHAATLVPGHHVTKACKTGRRYRLSFYSFLGTSLSHNYLNGKVPAPGLENREYGRGDPLRWPRDTLYPQKLALTSPTGGARSVGTVRLQTKATEFRFFF
jgi:hypothetical protein